MSSTWFKHTVLFLLLAFLQVTLFNRIHILGYATPLLYVYSIIKMPVDMNRNLVLLLSVLMGFIVDIFDFTLGLNMLACTLTGFSRFYFLKLFSPRDLIESVSPSFRSFGKGLFIRYASVVTFIHIMIVYFTESLTLFDPLHLIYRIVGSFLITIVLIFAVESLNWD